MRVLGIDLGGTRTGLALSDPGGLICSPLATLVERDQKRLIERIAVVVEEQGVDEVVLGLPRPLSGGTNEHMESVLAFKAKLESVLSVRVLTWDERFTSKLANENSVSRSGRDAVAASYILQNYLESRAEVTQNGDT